NLEYFCGYSKSFRLNKRARFLTLTHSVCYICRSMPHDKLTQNRDRAVAVIVTLISAAFVYCLVFKFFATPILFEGDHLIFLYDADRMLKGDVLYRDFTQFTFPGGQFVYYVL